MKMTGGMYFKESYYAQYDGYCVTACCGELPGGKKCGKIFSDNMDGEDPEDSEKIYYKVSAGNAVYICPLADKIDTTATEQRKRCTRGFCKPCYVALYRSTTQKTHETAPTTRSTRSKQKK